MKRARKGIMVHDGLTLEQILGLARQADERGFDGVFMVEEAGYNSLVALGAVATVTRRAQVGSSICSIYTRSAPIYAMAVNTLNDLSGGRALLGLGTSPPYFVRHWHDVPWERPVGRIKDYVHIIRAILSGEKVDYAGKAVSSRDFQLSVNPPGNRIPIYVGAIGPQMVRAAGEVADGVLLSPLVSEEYLAFAIERLREGAESAGRDYREIEIGAPIITTVDEDEGRALETARGMVAYFAVVYYYDFLFDLAGYGEVRREVARVNKERGFMEAIRLVPDGLIRKLSIVGTPAQCRQRLEELRAAGLELAILNAPGPRRVFGQPVRVPVDPRETCGAIVRHLAD